MIELTSGDATVRIRLTPGDADVAHWGETWMVYGEDACCKECGAVQHVKAVNEAFQHLPTCSSRAPYEQFPWRDLVWIMERMVDAPGRRPGN